MADQSQYKYANMSNLVLQADKRFIHRRTDEATGDPESMAGRVNIKQMGDRVLRDTAPKEKLKRKKAGQREKLNIDAMEEGKDILDREKRKRKREYENHSPKNRVWSMNSNIMIVVHLHTVEVSYLPRTTF